MKKLVVLTLTILLFSCASKKVADINKPLYELLTNQNDGGANIQFYEMITEPKEILMLLSDPNLKKKIKQEDIQNSNFVILNMGEKPSGDYKITIENVEETPTNIILTIKETKPTIKVKDISDAFFPYAIVKINSKKPIIIK